MQGWIAWLLGRYSTAYASNQFRALQQFFKWLAAEDEIPDPVAGLKPPHVPDKPVPVFADGELARLERACRGRSFQQRRDAAMIAVFTATGIRLSELAGLRYDPDDPQRSDIDLWQREITVCGKAGKTRTVKISYGAARGLDRYLRARARWLVIDLDSCQLSRPATSQHLRVLREAGLVSVRMEKNRRLYRVRADKLAELRAMLDEFWGSRLATLRAELAERDEETRP